MNLAATSPTFMCGSAFGAVVRKHMGYGPIGSEHAGAWHRFYTWQMGADGRIFD